MKTRVTLVCHGPTADNRTSAFPGDEPLEAKAINRTLLLKRQLERADRILVSPSMRTRQTAEILELAAEIEPRLAECDYGRWSGRTIEAIGQDEPEALAQWIGDFAASPHGGEAMSKVLARAEEWLNRSMAQGNHTIAITHSSIIRACLLHVLQAPATAFWKIDVEPLSVTHLASDGRRWTLRLPGMPGKSSG